MIRRTKVMKRSIRGFFTAIAIAGLWVGASMNASANIDWFFGPGGVFTGTGPNSSDWLQADLAQAGVDSVSVTLTWLTVPTGTKPRTTRRGSRNNRPRPADNPLETTTMGPSGPCGAEAADAVFARALTITSPSRSDCRSSSPASTR